MRSILSSHLIITKTPQNVHKICFIYHDMSRSELHFSLVDTVAVTLLGFIVAVRTSQM